MTTGIDAHQKKWVVFAICSGLLIFSFLYRAANAVIALDLTRDFGLTPQSLGLLSASFFYVNMLTQIPIGQCIDHFGGRRTMIIANLIGLAGVIIFSQANGLSVGLVGRGLLGGSMAVNLVGSLVLLSGLFAAKEFATISGFLISIGSLGYILAASPLRLLSDTIGWRGAFLVMAFIHLLLIMSLFAWGKAFDGDGETKADQNDADKNTYSTNGRLLTLLRNPNYWSIAVAAGIWYGAFAAIHTLWCGPFLMIHLGLSKLTASNLIFMLSIGIIVGSPLGGLLSDRIMKSRKKVLLLCLAWSAVSVLVLAYWTREMDPWVLAVLLFSFGLFGGFGSIFYAHSKDIMPIGMSGTAMGGINFFTGLGAALFLHGLGSVVGHGSKGIEAGGDYTSAFLICSGALLLAFLVYLFSRDTS